MRKVTGSIGDAIADDSSDDNRDDSCTPNYADNTALFDLFCLFRHFAWSWQCGGQGFESP